MINGNLEQFLDTGWWNADATIYYKDHIYFLDSYFDEKGAIHLRIMKWKAKIMIPKPTRMFTIQMENGSTLAK